MKAPSKIQLAAKGNAASSALLELVFWFGFGGTQRTIRAQGVLAFQNLDFEQAAISFDPNGYYPGYSVAANLALPGWTPYINGIPQTDVIYNTESTGGSEVDLFGAGSGWPVINGRFSVDLYGGVAGSPAAIAQTGLVPASASSIMFKAYNFAPGQGPLVVSLSGQPLAISPIFTGSNYTLYGASVSAFAGKTAQLSFSASAGANNSWILDDIAFSAAPVPEPGSAGLGLAGGAAIGVAGWLRGRAQLGGMRPAQGHAPRPLR